MKVNYRATNYIVDFIIVTAFIALVFNHEYYQILYNNQGVSYYYGLIPMVLYLVRLITVYQLYPKEILKSYNNIIIFFRHFGILGGFPALFMVFRIYYLEHRQLDMVPLRFGLYLKRLWQKEELISYANKYCINNSYSISPNHLVELATKASTIKELEQILDGYSIAAQVIDETKRLSIQSDKLPFTINNLFKVANTYLESTIMAVVNNPLPSMFIGSIFLILLNKYDIFYLKTAYVNIKSAIINITNTQEDTTDHLVNINKRILNYAIESREWYNSNNTISTPLANLINQNQEQINNLTNTQIETLNSLNTTNNALNDLNLRHQSITDQLSDQLDGLEGDIENNKNVLLELAEITSTVTTNPDIITRALGNLNLSPNQLENLYIFLNLITEDSNLLENIIANASESDGENNNRFHVINRPEDSTDNRSSHFSNLGPGRILSTGILESNDTDDTDDSK